MSNQTKHTPGPWRLGKAATSCGHLVYITIKANKFVEDRNKVFSTVSARTRDDVALSGVYAKNPNNGRTIGETYKELGETRYKPFLSEDECMANARLIAAAPELLEALQKAETAIDLLARRGNQAAIGILHHVRVAITKAEGRTP